MSEGKLEISRRGFLTWGGILGASAVLPGCAKEAVLRPKEEAAPPPGKEDFTQSVCPLCPAGCGVVVRRVDGRAVGVSGAPEHPVNLGSLCPKGAALLQELYHPDRLRSPLARGGERGRGSWAPISWDEAIRRIAGKLASFKPATLSAPRAEEADGELLRELARSLGGASYTIGVSQNELAQDAFRAMHGRGLLFCDPAQARLLVSFGFDWLQAHPDHLGAQQLWARLRSRAGGERTHVVQVESRFSVTAGKADAWVPALPGAEGFVALGAAREMIGTGRYDETFVRRRTTGFPALAKALEPFSIERVSEAAGVSERTLRLLYAKFQGARPAVAIGSRGAPWSQMAVHALNALSGSLGEEAIFSSGEEEDVPGAMDLNAPMPGVLLIDRVNPVFLSPARWKTALDKAPFIVAISPYLTETAEYADIVLPCHSPLERLHGSRHRLLDGRTVVNLSSRAVEPLYDTKDAGEIALLIGRAAGAKGLPAGDFSRRVEARVKELGAGALSLKDGEARWTESPGAGGRGVSFTTPSGRFDFEPLTRAIPGLPARSADEDFPLHLYVYPTLPFSFGEGAHLPYLQAIAGVQTGEMWETWVELHPETARACGVKEGGRVRLTSRLGRLEAKARVLASAMPGVVSVPFGLGHGAYGRYARGVGANPMDIAQAFAGERVRLEAA